MNQSQRANLGLVTQVGALIGNGFADPDENLFAPDFVFHFFNPHLAELDGDHAGLDGMRKLFERLQQTSDTGFHNEPHSLTPYGDELVVAYATNTVSFGGTALDVDAVVVWRVVSGRVQEAWDIPAINTVRPHDSDAERELPSAVGGEEADVDTAVTYEDVDQATISSSGT